MMGRGMKAEASPWRHDTSHPAAIPWGELTERRLAHRGECEHLTGDLPAARQRLSDAEAIARDLAVPPESELGKEIATLRASLDA